MLWDNFSYTCFSYIKRPDGEIITVDFIKGGKYEVEVMGKRHRADVHLTSPFDPLNKRLKGIYDDPLPVREAFGQE